MCVFVCVCVWGGGGGTLILSNIRRLGFKILNFNIFFIFFWGGGGGGGFRNIIIFGVMKILWIYHFKTGVNSIHFRFFFLEVHVQDGDIFWGSQKLQIFLGVWLIFPIYFGGRQ